MAPVPEMRSSRSPGMNFYSICSPQRPSVRIAFALFRVAVPFFGKNNFEIRFVNPILLSPILLIIVSYLCDVVGVAGGAVWWFERNRAGLHLFSKC